MAIDVYAVFTETNNAVLQGEGASVPFQVPSALNVQAPTNPIAYSSLTFEFENPTTIGSGSLPGPGKAKFDPLTLTKSFDKNSPLFFSYLTGGQHFKELTVLLVKSGGAGQASAFLRYSFATVYVTDLTWAYTNGDGSIAETVTLEYAGFQVAYATQNLDGTFSPTPYTASWSQLTNSNVFNPQ
jgi:type VI secretion system secreted protein Hcp